MADNYRFDVIHDRREALVLVLTLAMMRRGVIGYKKNDGQLELFWIEADEMVPLPCEIKHPEHLADLIEGWLEEVDYGPQPDHDGDNKKGFRVYNQEWGQPHSWKAFIGVEPVWCMYGK